MDQPRLEKMSHAEKTKMGYVPIFRLAENGVRPDFPHSGT
jgi:hypothetical protein